MRRSPSTMASPPRTESRAASSPAVSLSPIAVRLTRRMSPSSSPRSVFMTVTPVCVSPLTTAHCTGAAPRYLGRRLAWMFHTPSGNMSRISCDNICPKAQVTMRSAPSERTLSASSRMRAGCKTGIPCPRANVLTGGGVRTPFRPAGLSCCVITATTSYPDSRMLRKGATEKDGVPA